MKYIIQISKEGDVFEVPRSVGLMSVIVKETLCDEDDEDDDNDNDDNDDCDDAPLSGTNATNSNNKNRPDIPLPNVSAFILAKVIEYCKHYQHVEKMIPITTPLKSGKLVDLVQPWYAEYVKVDRAVLFDLAAAANFMDIKPLLDLTCLAVSIYIKGKSASELRTIFNLSSKLTPEEEEEIKRENAWIETNVSATTPTTTTAAVTGDSTKTPVPTTDDDSKKASTPASTTLLEPIDNSTTEPQTPEGK
jgi:S-phase kinase-associated protein 1